MRHTVALEAVFRQIICKGAENMAAMPCTTMDCLEIGQRAFVRALGLESSLRDRLQDLGLVEGTEVQCVLKSPAGDPAAYEIRGAVIALRRGDAATVQLELEPS